MLTLQGWEKDLIDHMRTLMVYGIDDVRVRVEAYDDQGTVVSASSRLAAPDDLISDDPRKVLMDLFESLAGAVERRANNKP